MAGGLILFESYRSRKKELARREGVADDIQTLQDEIEWLKAKLKDKRIVTDEYKLPDNVSPTILTIQKKTDTVPTAIVANNPAAS